MTYTCADCGGTFGSDTDHDAKAEFKENFGRDLRPDDVIVCDDCYKQIMKEIRTMERIQFTWRVNVVGNASLNTLIIVAPTMQEALTAAQRHVDDPDNGFESPSINGIDCQEKIHAVVPV